MTQPVEKTLNVPMTPEAAFDLFTQGIDRWWPKASHSTSTSDGAAPEEVRVEPFEGGRILEKRHDGETAEWGRITIWVPGQRLTCTWHPGRSADEATRLDIRFTADAIGCRIDLIHDGFDVLGAQATSMQANYTRGWDHVLAKYLQLLQKTAA